MGFSARPAGLLHPGRDVHEETLANAEEAITGYLEALVKDGQPIPEEPQRPAKVAVGVVLRVPATAS